MLNVVVTPRRFDNQGIPEQLRQGNLGFLRQRVIFRKNRTQRVVPQGIKAQRLRHNGGQKAAVHLAVENPGPDFVVVSVQDLYYQRENGVLPTPVGEVFRFMAANLSLFLAPGTLADCICMHCRRDKALPQSR